MTKTFNQFFIVEGQLYYEYKNEIMLITPEESIYPEVIDTLAKLEQSRTRVYDVIVNFKEKMLHGEIVVDSNGMILVGMDDEIVIKRVNKYE